MLTAETFIPSRCLALVSPAKFSASAGSHSSYKEDGKEGGLLTCEDDDGDALNAHALLDVIFGSQASIFFYDLWRRVAPYCTVLRRCA